MLLHQSGQIWSLNFDSVFHCRGDVHTQWCHKADFTLKIYIFHFSFICLLSTLQCIRTRNVNNLFMKQRSTCTFLRNLQSYKKCDAVLTLYSCCFFFFLYKVKVYLIYKSQKPSHGPVITSVTYYVKICDVYRWYRLLVARLLWLNSKRT